LDPDSAGASGPQLVPVLPLTDLCLFPGASLAVVVAHPSAVAALKMALRTGGPVLAVSHRESAVTARDLPAIGTLATVRDVEEVAPLEHRIELDGLARAEVRTIVGTDLLVAEAALVPEGDPGDEWGPAVEALARYLHAHADLRAFLEEQRHTGEAMSWVNLACQHLPIAASARQRLLESSAAQRCTKISRGLDALLRKEQGP
jgi:ATP-dependent Lon protease